LHLKKLGDNITNFSDDDLVGECFLLFITATDYQNRRFVSFLPFWARTSYFLRVWAKLNYWDIQNVNKRHLNQEMCLAFLSFVAMPIESNTVGLVEMHLLLSWLLTVISGLRMESFCICKQEWRAEKNVLHRSVLVMAARKFNLGAKRKEFGW